jgi:hypothetical protein
MPACSQQLALTTALSPCAKCGHVTLRPSSLPALDEKPSLAASSRAARAISSPPTAIAPAAVSGRSHARTRAVIRHRQVGAL